ncbi:hypothetical protein [Actimicrobium antarcticum]|uniref:Uncharacterized protein n=1 Tax=Actimicrobium antarcticum TaxID=1051899 RepID=A0ABP7TNK8_9BURK
MSSLNTWNNTAFAKLCMGGMSEVELEKLAHNPELSADKREIAAGKLEELYGVTTGNQV